jgi:hypothetical protein
MMMMGLDDNQKIGVLLLMLSFVFLWLGVMLLLDGALLAVGDLFLVGGLVLVIGPGRALAFFAQRKRCAKHVTSCLLSVCLICVCSAGCEARSASLLVLCWC